jgi:phosphatidylethanolamine-binding protein (PEBP) family uncharacterized protein
VPSSYFRFEEPNIAPTAEMPLLRAAAAIAAASAAAATASAFDSRNVSAEQWVCSEETALSVSFDASGGPDAVGCGAEVLWLASQTQPAFAYSAANTASLYTLLVLDRDAPNAAAPIRSPLIHMALADVDGAELAAGRFSNVRAMFPYAGPRPPAGSLCHRYYVQLYEQDAGVSPELNVSAIGRFSFDFVTWSAENSLTRIPEALAYFQTQNDTARTGPCGAPVSPSAAPSPTRSAAPAPATLAAALAAVVVAALAALV